MERCTGGTFKEASPGGQYPGFFWRGSEGFDVLIVEYIHPKSYYWVADKELKLSNIMGIYIYSKLYGFSPI